MTLNTLNALFYMTIMTFYMTLFIFMCEKEINQINQIRISNIMPRYFMLCFINILNYPFPICRAAFYILTEIYHPLVQLKNKHDLLGKYYNKL